MRLVIDDINGIATEQITVYGIGASERVQGFDGLVFEARDLDGCGEGMGFGVCEERSVGGGFCVASCSVSVYYYNRERDYTIPSCGS